MAVVGLDRLFGVAWRGVARLGVWRLGSPASRPARLALATAIAALGVVSQLPARAAEPSQLALSPIKERHIGGSRVGATQAPRSEGDQAVVDGWPLYRSERGQTAFNDAMATLKATEGPAPSASTFKSCPDLVCNLSLPALSADGWLPAGRYWVSPAEYVVIAHSPRARNGNYRRHPARSMRYFVYHEFHNGTRNTDPYDTISSHSGSVYVSFYMSKQATDAAGRRFVVVVQVAPHDVVSIHASDKGSAGPGIEVAKNVTDTLEPLQGTAGILVATIVKTAVPHLKVVNHRGSEGQPMLAGYERRLAALKARADAPSLALPFVAASAQRVVAATEALDRLISPRGASPRIAIAERGIVPRKGQSRRGRHEPVQSQPPPSETASAEPPVAANAASEPPAPAQAPAAVAHAETAPREPSPPAVPPAAPAETAEMSPLASYLRANLSAMKRLPALADVIPREVAAIAEEGPQAGAVYLLDSEHQILGRIQPQVPYGLPSAGAFVYVPLDRETDGEKPFSLDLSKPAAAQVAALTAAADEPRLLEPIRPASRQACSITGC